MLTLFEMALTAEEVVSIELLEAIPEEPWQEPPLVPVICVRRGPFVAFRFLYDSDDPRAGQ